jgi:chromosome segregation protein
MKIKSIDIVGFKSFPERTRVAFPAGISAIVGPNGCGKSNILDAFRWVMGEQSPKQLRGRQMDDVLFNGTLAQRPAGLAEVALCLSNGNGHGPSDLAGPSEITVTRRLYRSGDSEYLINNISCRLKDIVQLLMEAGMGTKAYSTIEQGHIGTLVDAKPEDRRLLIDEAAGITRYKAQKRESERKIEATQVNLESIASVMAETKRQLGVLTRAARKAERYRELKSELKALDLSLAAIQMRDLDGRHAALTAERSLAQNDLTACLAGVDRLEVQVEETRLKIVEHEKEVDAATARYHDLRNEFGRLEQEQAFLGRQIEDQQKRRSLMSDELAQLTGRSQEIAGSLAGAREEMERQGRELKEAEGQQARSRSDLERLRQESRASLAHRDGLRLEEAAVRTRLGRSEEIIAALERRGQDLLQRREEMEHAAGSLEAEASRLQAQTAALAERARDLVREQEVRQTRLAARQEERRAHEAKLEALRGEAQKSESRLAQAAARLAALKEVQNTFGWYPEGVQAVMASPELKAAGVLGPLADQIVVPKGYEQAVEAALGDRLQYLLVRDRSAAASALAFLKERNLGRCGFISLADLAAGDPPDFLKALLGDYKLVEDGPAALGEPLTTPVLTRDGLFLHPSGLISGGVPRDNEQGLLVRRQEIEALAAQVSRLEIEAGDCLARVQAAKAEGEALSERIAADEAELRAAQVERLDAEKRLSQAQAQEKENQNRRAEGLRGRERLDAECRRLDQDREAAEAERLRLEDEAFDFEQKLETAEAGVQAVMDRLEQAQEQDRQDTLAAGTLAGRIRTLELDIQRQTEWLENVRASMKEKQDGLAVSQADEERLRGRREEVGRILDGFEQRLAQAEQEILEVKKKIDGLRALENAQTNELRQMRRRQEELNGLVGRLDLDVQEVGFKRQGLVERIENDYHLNLCALPEAEQALLDPALDPAEAKTRRDELKEKIEALGEVNLTAISEEEAIKERYEFYKVQYDDLVRSIENLQDSIARINRTCRVRFLDTFRAVDSKLREVFPILFGGGEAWLSLTDEQNPLDCGVEIHVHPPGKKLTVMSLLSGGEKALVALTVIFSLYLIKPSPFCLLDEIDAPLDESNIDRFNKLLQKLRQSSQIVLITHNKRTMQIAETLYGVTMEEPGVSKLVSVNLKEIEEKLEHDQMV